jgi:plastocyanin
MQQRLRIVPPALAAALLLTSPMAVAAPAPVTLVLKDHRFTPAVVTVPAGQKVQIVLLNQDKATEEFDSHDLKVEKLVTPNGRATFTVGPLKPGAYSFMGEFHPATAQGKIVAVQDPR